MSTQTFPVPPGRFPMRKAFNELRGRWEAIHNVAHGSFADLAECSYASTPLVTHGAWRGHTFASASMHHFFKQHVSPYLEEIQQSADVSQRVRTRGRKSKRAAYVSNMLQRLRELHKEIHSDDESGSSCHAPSEWLPTDPWLEIFEMPAQG